MSLIEPVPWGRNHAEYLGMFDLADLPLQARILDVGAGPASFAAERTALGGCVVACDPLFGASRDDIAARIEAARAPIMRLVRAERERFVWRDIPSPEALERIRLAAMRCFLADFDRGRTEGRYRTDRLPTLGFPDEAFDLVLCSHLLFLYSDRLDLAFHLEALREMLRVGREVRVFPLLDMEGRRSPHVAPLLARLTEQEMGAEIRSVPYEFQRGGCEMLRVTARKAA